VGVRKVLGSGKKRLVIQFIGEAVFMALIATVSSYYYATCTSSFNSLVQKELSID
jgi:hypothetical protein